jgi:hypothetical protein
MKHKLVKMGRDAVYCLHCKGVWSSSFAHIPHMECVGVYAYLTPDEIATENGAALIAAWEKETCRE